MKFRVRDQFFCTVYAVSETTKDGKKVKRVNEQRFTEGDEMNLTAEQAALEAARIEPIDAEAAAFMEGLTLHASLPVANTDEFRAAVAAEVNKALAAAGVRAKVPA